MCSLGDLFNVLSVVTYKVDLGSIDFAMFPEGQCKDTF